MNDAKIITRCIDLTIDRFIDCLVHQNHKALIIEGQADEKECETAWEAILEEYRNLSGLPSHLRTQTLIKSIALLSYRLKVIEWNLHVLQIGYFAENVKAIQDLGFTEKFPQDDPEQYFKDFTSVQNKSNAWALELQVKQKQLEESREKVSNVAVSEEAILRNIAILEDKSNTTLSIKTLTVAEYCSKIKYWFNG